MGRVLSCQESTHGYDVGRESAAIGETQKWTVVLAEGTVLLLAAAFLGELAMRTEELSRR